MNELKLLSSCLMDRGCYTLVNKYVENKELTPEGQKILSAIGDYYTRDPQTKNCDREVVEELLLQSIPAHLDKPREALKMVIDRIPKEVSPENLSHYILAIKRENTEADLNSAIMAKKSPKEIAFLMDKWRELQTDSLELEDTEQVYIGWDVEDLVATHYDPKHLIKFLPKKLNDKLDGGAKPGHHVLIFAPSELGKSLFCINLTYGFLIQNLRVLYVGNEDPVADLNMRLINRITHMNKKQVNESPTKAKELLAKSNYKNFAIMDAAPGTFMKIKEITSEFDPHVVIIDQLPNIDMSVGDQPVIQMMLAAKASRKLAKSEARLVIPVAQASDDAYGKLALRKNDVQWSNVDFPAQMDAMIGVAATEEMERVGTRRICFPKNKLSGDHEPLDVMFVKEFSEVEEFE